MEDRIMSARVANGGVSMLAARLSTILAASVFTDCRARWAYRAVVWI